jgi:hypothetical protein
VMTLSADMECSEQGMDFDVQAFIASKDGALVRVHVAASAGHTIEGLHKFSAMFFNIQEHTLVELMKQNESAPGVMVELKRELHFDSHGYLYGRLGYLRASVDPDAWDIHLWGGHWIPLEQWQGDVDTVEDNTEFRRKLGRGLTHEELNATK